MVTEESSKATDETDSDTRSHLQIVRLVSGDLRESDRTQLLEWLDAEPLRWRRCGLAFLESQVLREAIAGLCEETKGLLPAAGDDKAELASIQDKGRRQRPRHQRRLLGLVAVAAVLFFAFGVGWLARGSSHPMELAPRTHPKSKFANGDLPREATDKNDEHDV